MIEADAQSTWSMLQDPVGGIVPAPPGTDMVASLTTPRNAQPGKAKAAPNTNGKSKKSAAKDSIQPERHMSPDPKEDGTGIQVGW